MHFEKHRNSEKIECYLNELVKQPISQLQFIGGGGNNQIYRFVADGSESLVAKLFYYHSADKRDRAATEYVAMKLLWDNGFSCIPELRYYDKNQRCIISECIDGRKLQTNEIKSSHIDQTIQFLLQLYRLSQLDASNVLNLATEASFSLENIVNCIKLRLNKFMHVIGDDRKQVLLKDYIHNMFLPEFEPYVAQLRKKTDYTQCAPLGHITISPADIGFHNTLLCINGELKFIDFEYFGWDDSAKLVADYLLHPGMSLSNKLKQYFLQQLLSKWPGSPGLEERLKETYSLTAFKWCLILLNEFLPFEMEKRILASKNLLHADDKKLEQMEKAKNMLQHAGQSILNFPYKMTN